LTRYEEAQNNATCAAHQAQDLIDEEERHLEKDEAIVAANQDIAAAKLAADNAIFAAKACTEEARVGR
jgi:hypothetical protein